MQRTGPATADLTPAQWTSGGVPDAARAGTIVSAGKPAATATGAMLAKVSVKLPHGLAVRSARSTR